MHFFVNALFWAPGDNLGLKHPTNSCKQAAFVAGVQKKPKQFFRAQSLSIDKIIKHMAWNKSRKIPLLVMYYLTKFDDVI